MFDNFLVLNNGIATYYSGNNGEIISQTDDVVEIGVQGNYERFIVTKSDGVMYELKGNVREGYIWESYDENSIKLPIQQEESMVYGKEYILDADNTLWCDDDLKKIAENVTYMNSEVYLSNGVLYSFEDNSVILTDIQEVYWEDYGDGMTHYLTADGIVWEVIDAERKNKVLTSVADMIVGRNYVYMVRQDGSVWKYRNYEDAIGVAYMVQTGDSIVMGDISGDGEVKINDMLTILHGISGSQTLDESQQNAADIDKDGKVTVRDMLRIMHYISGASSEL